MNNSQKECANPVMVAGFSCGPPVCQVVADALAFSAQWIEGSLGQPSLLSESLAFD